MDKGLHSVIDNFKNQNILVLGDLILDEYIKGTAIGKSSEGPLLVIKEQETTQYVGGAGIVSKHIKALGGNPTFITVLGNDRQGNEFNLNNDVKTFFFFDNTRRTTIKTRILADGQKILRLSKLDEHYIDEKIENNIINIIRNRGRLDGIIISDFNYGIITPGILDFVIKYAKKNNILLFGDTQCSSQVGDVLKFKDFYLITPTEKEARIALRDELSTPDQLIKELKHKTRAKNVCLTMGSKGFKFYGEKGMWYYPAINNAPLDTIGAGDSMLSMFAMALCSNATVEHACKLAGIMASIAISKEGNQAISIEEVKDKL